MNWKQILLWIDDLLNAIVYGDGINSNSKSMQEPVLSMQTTPVIPTTAPPSLLNTFCTAIKSREGFYAPCPQYPQGTPSWRNNNPGNARFSSVGYLSIYEPVARSTSGFAVFKDYATGWLYLENMVKEKIALHPNETIQDFFNSYAPKSDGNDPVSYALEVAKKCGLSVDSKVAVVI